MDGNNTLMYRICIILNRKAHIPNKLMVKKNPFTLNNKAIRPLNSTEWRFQFKLLSWRSNKTAHTQYISLSNKSWRQQFMNSFLLKGENNSDDKKTTHVVGSGSMPQYKFVL